MTIEKLPALPGGYRWAITDGSIYESYAVDDQRYLEIQKRHKIQTGLFLNRINYVWRIYKDLYSLLDLETLDIESELDRVANDLFSKFNTAKSKNSQVQENLRKLGNYNEQNP